MRRNPYYRVVAHFLASSSSPILRSVRLPRRVELNLYVCSPFGTYEIDLDVESYSDESVEMVEYPASTSWTIRNGHDKVWTEQSNLQQNGGSCEIRTCRWPLRPSICVNRKNFCR